MTRSERRQRRLLETLLVLTLGLYAIVSGVGLYLLS